MRISKKNVIKTLSAIVILVLMMSMTVFAAEEAVYEPKM